MVRLALLTVVFCLAAPSAFADELPAEFLDNWHQWRGPRADGLAPNGDPPIQWDEKTNVKWKVAVPGEGSATPIVWGKQIFVVLAVNTGREVTSLQPPRVEPPGGYKTPRPATYYRFVVICIDRDTGHVIWQRIAREIVPHEGRHRGHSRKLTVSCHRSDNTAPILLVAQTSAVCRTQAVFAHETTS